MTIRIASYNLWNGSSETYFRLVDFVKEQKYDVLCLQEINGWENNDFERLKEFADRTGFTDYEFGNSNSEYKLVTLSTLPITARTVHVEGFWHCIVEVHVQVDDSEIAILNVHLDPWKEEPRLREVSRLFELIDLGKPTLLIGDFNSVSRADNYPPEFLTELAKRKFYKFGQTELDFRVTDTLASAGFIDAAAKLNRMDTTAPTEYGKSKDKGEAVPVSEAPARIDYAFANSILAPQIRSFDVIKSEETEKISDHYPIVMTLETSGPVATKDNSAAEIESDEIPQLPDKEQPKQSENGRQNSPIEGEIKLH